MNNPLETYDFRFFLNFKNDDSFGKIEITEPVGFDVYTSVLEQEYVFGRDIFFGAEDIKLQFKDVTTITSSAPIVLPDGVIIDRLTMGLPFLLEYHKLYGYESEVEFSILKGEDEFILGLIDFSLAETDGLTYFNCVVITKTDRAVLKRREETKVDVYSNEDLDGNPSEPVETHSILLKAKPVRQISYWENDKTYEFSDTNIPFNSYAMFNYGTQLLRSEVQDSLVVFENKLQFTDSDSLFDSFRVVKAQTRLNDVKIILELDITFQFIQDSGFPSVGIFQINAAFGNDNDPDIPSQSFYSKETDESFTEVVNGTFEIDVPVIEPGQVILIWGLVSRSADGFAGGVVRKWKQTIEVTSTAVDSVITGVRHIDFIKKVAEKSAGFEVIAPRYDIGGQFYDNFVFNGYGIRQFLEKPFHSSWKEAIAQLDELCSGVQIIDDKKVYIGNYKDFYSIRDLGAFLQIPDSEFEIEFNPDYKAQNFNYKYKSFEQGKDEENTIDAVHTQSEWFLPNNQIEGIKSIDVDYVRDPFKIEFVRQQNVASTNTKSLSEDTDKFIIDCVPLPPNSRNSISNVFDFQITLIEGTYFIKILAKDNFRWDLLGFEVGADVNFSFTYNGTAYSWYQAVSDIEPTLLTIDIGSISLPPGLSEGAYTEFATLEYPLQNVHWVNRTNQDFQVIENVIEPDNFGNLQYTIRRNMKHWESFINTLCNYSQNGTIRNTFFEPNGELITEFQNGGLIKENANIPVSELDTRKVTSLVYHTRVFCTFEQIIQLLKDLDTINENDTIGGFVRIYNQESKLLKGYPKKLTYFWGTGILEGEFVEKYEDDFVSVLKRGDIYFIDETGYDIDLIGHLQYKANGNYLQLFDKRNIPLTKPHHFSGFRVAGLPAFSDIIQLCKAIDEL